jgi:hypothetical protein
MNWAWRDGKMSVEHYKEEHELDTETLAETTEETTPKQANEVAAKPDDKPSKE